MYLMALTFVGLASMPQLLTVKPSSFPNGTPNMHLVEFSFHLNFLRFFKCFSKVGNELIIVLGLDDDVINIGLGVTPNLPLESFLDGLQVCSTRVLEAEHHGVVAVCPEGRDEGGLLLIRLILGDLMVA